MHEASLIRGLIRQVETIVRREKAARALKIDVILGALSHFSPDHFREHFDQESPGTLAEGAQLVIVMDENPQWEHAQGVWIRSVEVAD